jgi:tRNA(Ile2)-agmatinylcytidine synthase
MPYISVDDTDSVRGMCTTFLMTEIIRELNELDVIGYPRLVRLNPNIPWKTRGNAALYVRLGNGYGRRFEIGEISGRPIYAYENGREAGDKEEVFDKIKDLVEKWAVFDDEKTNPGFAVSERKVPESFYWKAVRTVVSLEDAISELERIGALYYGFKNRRGLIGSTAALSWRPKKRTYELIAYRHRDRWGTKREIDESSVIDMDLKFPETFDNYDYRNRYVAITPHTPGPILYGIRSVNPEILEKAHSMIEGEKAERWIIFQSNQGTDDHMVRKRIGDICGFESVIVRGRVTEEPRAIEGGHVIFSISDGTGEVDCAAYEPTKEFRDVVRELIKGDLVEIYGGVHDGPFTLNIEKMRVLELQKKMVKVHNPRCPKCGKRMKSTGRDGYYRCKSCGIKIKGGEEFEEVERKIRTGWYEVPVCARRHLSMPLKIRPLL